MNKTLEALARAYQEVTEKMDPVNKKALKKDFDDREDKDIDNDGDVDSSDKYLHNRRKTISKKVKGDTATMNPKLSNSKSNTASEQKEEVEVDEALKPYDKNADFRVVNRLKPKQRTGTLTPGEKKQLANAEARLRNHGVKEGTIRDKLLSVLEKKTHGDTEEKQAYDDNWSPSAKKMAADHKPEVQADAKKAAEDNVRQAELKSKVAPKNPTDKNAKGDKNVINPPEDITKKGGVKESFSSVIRGIASAYSQMKQPKE